MLKVIQAFGLTSAPRKAQPPAVDDVSFEARAGHVTSLLGSAGAGKTTVLRLMLELQQGRGVTCFRGRPLHRIAHPSREVGVLLGDVPGHPARSVRGHLRMLCAASGVPARRADEVLEVVGLVSLREERLGALSRGMDRRLGLACALLPDPHTLVLDEPAAGLSAREAQWLYGMLRAHADHSGTVFVTTADPKEAARAADRIVTLDGGRLVADQDAKEFARNRLRARVAVRSPHAARLAALLAREARTTRRSVEVVRECGNRLSVYGTTTADIGETAFRHGILVHQLADEVGDMGPGAGAGRDGGTGAGREQRSTRYQPVAQDGSPGEPERTASGACPVERGTPGVPAPDASQADRNLVTSDGPSGQREHTAGEGSPMGDRAASGFTPDGLIPAGSASAEEGRAGGHGRSSATGDPSRPPAPDVAERHHGLDRELSPAPVADGADGTAYGAGLSGIGADTRPREALARADGSRAVNATVPSEPAHARHTGHTGLTEPPHSQVDGATPPPAAVSTTRTRLPGARTPGPGKQRPSRAPRPEGVRSPDTLSLLPPPISVRPAPTPLRPLRYEIRRAVGVGTDFLVCGVTLLVSALVAVVLARLGHTPQARLFAAWPGELPLPPAALAAGLLGALSFGDEFRHPALAADRGTVPRRLGLLVAKLLVSGTIALFLALLAVGCDAEVLYIVYGRELSQVPGGWLSSCASWFGLVACCAWVGVLAGGVFRSTTAGLAAVLAVPVVVAPFVHEVLQGPGTRVAAGLLTRMREAFLLQWPFGGERYLIGTAHVVAQPMGEALALSLGALLCAYLVTMLRSRGR
ncbi:ATP-binding cassette domain-containing protein [Streptomyces sp. MUM 16J]|uniref:ABC transporter ATP-binding protein n=1 Tax=Streptomyces sp. MUM 16J TaxID=2791988 RepID=UPI0023D9523D